MMLLRIPDSSTMREERMARQQQDVIKLPVSATDALLLVRQSAMLQ